MSDIIRVSDDPRCLDYENDPRILRAIKLLRQQGYTQQLVADTIGVRRETLWYWSKRNQELCDLMAERRHEMRRKAQDRMFRALDDEDIAGVNAAKFVLERLDPDFKPKQDIRHAVEQPLESLVEQLGQLSPEARAILKRDLEAAQEGGGALPDSAQGGNGHSNGNGHNGEAGG